MLRVELDFMPKICKYLDQYLIDAYQDMVLCSGELKMQFVNSL